MNPYDVLLRPLLSEKSVEDRESFGRYSFYVHTDASKTDVKSSVEKLFDVTVESVATQVLRGKTKRRGAHVAMTGKRKKAVVKLAEGQKISIFEDQ